jgi:hypothetical protein
MLSRFDGFNASSHAFASGSSSGVPYERQVVAQRCACKAFISWSCSLTYPALVFWCLLGASIFSPLEVVLGMLISSLPFGSLSLLPAEAIGGVTILPQSAFAALFIARVAFTSDITAPARVRRLLSLRRGGLLILFLAAGFCVTAFAPSLLRDTIVIVPMRLTGVLVLDTLAPSQANFTQSMYVALSVALVFSTALLTKRKQFISLILTAFLVGGSITVITGVADFVLAAGHSDLLEPFRNASYALLTEAQVQGARRVVGLMPEASAFGALAVGFASALAFFWPFFDSTVTRLLAVILCLLLVGAALLSTSSTAYGGLAVLVLCYLAGWLHRLVRGHDTEHKALKIELVAASMASFFAFLVFAAKPELLDPLSELADAMIFNKANTLSFYERSVWNTTSWSAFMESWGLGVGLGSTRTSNWFVSIISNTGTFGALFLGLFLLQTFMGRRRDDLYLSALLNACKLALIPNFAMAAVAGTTPDFGPSIAILLGIITGLPDREQLSTEPTKNPATPSELAKVLSRRSSSDGSDLRSHGQRY